MNDQSKDGGPAFPEAFTVPAHSPTGSGTDYPHEAYVASRGGMSLRDWFAGQSLTAACQSALHETSSPLGRGGTEIRLRLDREEAANAAYEIADAMLRRRNRNP